MAAEMIIQERLDITNGSRIRVLNLLCTCETDGTLGIELTDEMFDWIKGWKLAMMEIANSSGQTDPAADSDVTALLTGGADFFLGGGVDKLQPDTSTLTPTSSLGNMPIYEKFTITTANVGAVAAVFNLKLIVFPLT